MVMLDMTENRKMEVVLKMYRTVGEEDIFLSQEHKSPCMSEQRK